MRPFCASCDTTTFVRSFVSNEMIPEQVLGSIAMSYIVGSLLTYDFDCRGVARARVATACHSGNILPGQANTFPVWFVADLRSPVWH